MSNQGVSVGQIDREMRQIVGSIHLNDDEDEQMLIGMRDAFVAMMRLLRQRLAAEDAEEMTSRSDVIIPIIALNDSIDRSSGHHLDFNDLVRENNDLRSRLNESEGRFMRDLDLALVKLQNDLEGKFQKDAETIRADGEHRLAAAVKETKLMHQLALTGSVEVERRKVSEFEQHVTYLKQVLKDKESKCNEVESKLNENHVTIEKLMQTERQLREEMKAQEKSNMENVSRLSEEKSKDVRSLEMEMMELKKKTEIQCREISILEEKFGQAMQKSKELKSRTKQLEKENKELRAENQEIKIGAKDWEWKNKELEWKNKELQTENKSLHDTLTQSVNRETMTMTGSTLTKGQEETDDVKNSTSGLEKEPETIIDDKGFVQILREKESIIAMLKLDLITADARLCALRGELNDGEKQDLERVKKTNSRQETEIKKLKRELKNNKDTIDRKDDTIKALEVELRKQKVSLNESKEKLSRKMAEVKTLKDKMAEMLENTSNAQSNQDNIDAETQALATIHRIGLMENSTTELRSCSEDLVADLVDLGRQCKGDRHLQIIENQIETLSELRERVKATNNLSLTGNPDHNLQRIIELEAEFEQLVSSRPNIGQIEVETESTEVIAVQRLETCGYVRQTYLDMEVSAHDETMSSLEHSENSYFLVVRCICAALNLEDADVERSMAHRPEGDCQSLEKERKDMCYRITGEIGMIKERLERKEELVADYEKNLMRLREAQAFAAQCSEKAEELITEINCVKDENECLREIMNRLKEELDCREKQINDSMKERKPSRSTSANVISRVQTKQI